MSFSIDRLGLLRKRLDALGAAGMYIRDVADLEWLTAFEDVFDDERAHAAFVDTADRCIKLHTDSRYVTAMEMAALWEPIGVDAKRCSTAEWVRERWEGRADVDGAQRPLAIEDSISLREYRELQEAFRGEEAAAGSPFLETHDVVLGLRAVKDADEVARLRAAQAITDAAFAHIVDFIRPGMTERQVQLELDGFMLRNGATGLAFPTIVASGANGASPHAVVSDKPLAAGECVVMDFGAKRAGYCSDMTRTVFLGQPEGEVLAAWETMRRANEEVQAMLRPGVTGKEAHELAERVLEEGGFEGRMGHGLGHGVGLQVHELPVLSSRNDKPLVAGNVVTVEPGIYLPGRFGMRLEDFGVVTDDGFDVFTRSTHDMVVL